jgi:hypothetical protein
MTRWKLSIPPLESLSLWMRIALIVIVVLLTVFIIGMLSIEGAPEEWIPSRWDDHIDDLERQALDEAFKKHIMQLYSVWVTDNYQPRIPPKALVGARHARDAYIRSMEAIDKRRAKAP